MGKNKKLYQFLQENGVAALQTICSENKNYVHFQMSKSFFSLIVK